MDRTNQRRFDSNFAKGVNSYYLKIDLYNLNIDELKYFKLSN